MSSFISAKASVKGYIEDDAVILGPTSIGSATLIGKGVIVGYPVEPTLRSIIQSQKFDIREYDAMSRGATIGDDCIIRSGTIVYETAAINNRVRTGHHVLIREGSIVGEDTVIGSSAKLDGKVLIGKGVKIQSNAYLPNLTIVEDNVFIAPYVCVTNDPYPPSRHLIGVTIEKNAIVCANATIIAGVRIGRNAVVGAGSVVTKDVPADVVVIGSPAHFHITRREFDKKKEVWEKDLDAKIQET